MRVPVLVAPSPMDPELHRQVLQHLQWLERAGLVLAACHLMKSMGYRDVEIVGNPHKHGRSEYGGVDITAWIARGAVRVKTVAQVKSVRDGRTVQRRFVDQLRGVMPTYGAAQAIIFTNQTFAPVAETVADISFGRPVRLIQGSSMARLMIKNGLGVRLKPLAVHSLPELMLDTVFFDRLKELAGE